MKMQKKFPRVLGHFFLSLFLLCFLALPSEALAGSGPVFDQANLLSDQEEAQLSAKIAQLQEEFGFEMGIYLLDDASLSSSLENDVKYTLAPEDFREDRFIFALNMANRRMAMEINGTARDEISDNQTNDILDYGAPSFTAGQYYDGFMAMLDYTEEHLDGTVKWKENLPILGACILGGLVLAGGITWYMVHQMNTLRPEDRAAAYLNQQEFNVTLNRETFLYRNVTKTPKAKSSGGGGGGGGGRSSGGASRGF